MPIRFAFVFLLFSFTFESSADKVTSGGAQENPAQARAADPAESPAVQVCGGKLASEADPKKFNNCVDWQNKSADGDKLQADKDCGGAVNYNLDKQKFVICSSNRRNVLLYKRQWSEKQCGGFDAYTSEKQKFRTCLTEKFKIAPDEPPPDPK